MTNKKPYILFHGYTKFEKRLMLSPTQPLWTSDYVQAEWYVGKDNMSGMLVMIINTDKLKILDMHNEKDMTTVYGKGIYTLFKASESKSFFEFINFIRDQFKRYNGNYLSILQQQYHITTDKQSLDILTRIFKLWKNNKHFSIDNDYTPKIFTPIAAAYGYNCIIEHEDNRGGFEDDQYLLFSSELLEGRCCKFLSREKLYNNNYKLNSLDIWDIKSVSIIKSL